jgi:hypothetical protein
MIMRIETSEEPKQRMLTLLAIVGAVLSLVGWLRFFRVGLL